MIAFVEALVWFTGLSSAPAMPLPIEQRYPAVNHFVAACLNGERKFYVQAKRLPHKKLPRVVRRITPAKRGEYIRLVPDASDFLIFEQGRDARGFEASVCLVAAHGLDIEEAFAQINESRSGEALRRYNPPRGVRVVAHSFTSDDLRHRVSAYSIGAGYVLMRVAKLSEAGKLDAASEKQRDNAMLQNRLQQGK